MRDIGAQTKLKEQYYLMPFITTKPSKSRKLIRIRYASQVCTMDIMLLGLEMEQRDWNS